LGLPPGRPGEAYYLIASISGNLPSGRPGGAYYLTTTICGELTFKEAG